MEAGDHQVASGPAEIAAQGNQPGKGVSRCLDNSLEFEANHVVTPDS